MIAYLTARYERRTLFFYRYIIPNGIFQPTFAFWLSMQFNRLPRWDITPLTRH